MSQNPTFSKPQVTQQLALLGAETAADHADRVHGDWTLVAWDFFVRFAKGRDEPFMTEDVRILAEKEKAVPSAPDSRAWGVIALRAAKGRLIKRVGYAPN